MSAQDVCGAEVVDKMTLRVDGINCPKGNLDVILKSGSCWKMLKVKERESVDCSVVSDSCDLVDLALQAPLSMEFSRQEYWSGQPFPSPGDLPDPGIKPGSPAL